VIVDGALVMKLLTMWLLRLGQENPIPFHSSMSPPQRGEEALQEPHTIGFAPYGFQNRFADTTPTDTATSSSVSLFDFKVQEDTT
jgi:hypothetical protein